MTYKWKLKYPDSTKEIPMETVLELFIQDQWYGPYGRSSWLKIGFPSNIWQNSGVPSLWDVLKDKIKRKETSVKFKLLAETLSQREWHINFNCCYILRSTYFVPCLVLYRVLSCARRDCWLTKPRYQSSWIDIHPRMCLH